jgi:hypothetical protein
MMLISAPSSTDCVSTDCERDEDSSSSWWRYMLVSPLAELEAAWPSDSAVLPCQLPECSGGGDECAAISLTVSPSTDCVSTDCERDVCEEDEEEESESWLRYMLVSPWAELEAAWPSDSAVLPCQLPECSGGGE